MCVCARARATQLGSRTLRRLDRHQLRCYARERRNTVATVIKHRYTDTYIRVITATDELLLLCVFLCVVALSPIAIITVDNCYRQSFVHSGVGRVFGLGGVVRCVHLVSK